MITVPGIPGSSSMLSFALNESIDAASRIDRESSLFTSVDTMVVSGCSRGMSLSSNDATLFWMGVTGLVICGLFGLNRYRQRIYEQQDMKTITAILKDEKSLTAAEIVKASIRGGSSLSPLSLSSVYVTLSKMEDRGLLESWDPQPAANDAQISQARERRLYRLARR